MSGAFYHHQAAVFYPILHNPGIGQRRRSVDVYKRQAIYLLKSESDTKILEVAVSCCHAILQKREEKSYLSEMCIRDSPSTL